PEAHVGDGEGLVVAHILTTGLLRVALEGRLFVPPGRLHSCPKHQDPEDEEYGQPDFAPCGGVGLHLVQQAPESTPVTHPRT
ncbi:hypothetical protein NL108_004746, partial [Boleophthalmus pectinirostris]